jgi:hypothetical protein
MAGRFPSAAESPQTALDDAPSPIRPLKSIKSASDSGQLSTEYTPSALQSLSPDAK